MRLGRNDPKYDGFHLFPRCTKPAKSTCSRKRRCRLRGVLLEVVGVVPCEVDVWRDEGVRRNHERGSSGRGQRFGQCRDGSTQINKAEVQSAGRGIQRAGARKSLDRLQVLFCINGSMRSEGAVSGRHTAPHSDVVHREPNVCVPYIEVNEGREPARSNLKRVRLRNELCPLGVLVFRRWWLEALVLVRRCLVRCLVGMSIGLGC